MVIVKGGHGVLELAQLERVRLGNEVSADRERLGELDERGTELCREVERLLGALLFVGPRLILGRARTLVRKVVEAEARVEASR